MKYYLSRYLPAWTRWLCGGVLASQRTWRAICDLSRPLAERRTALRRVAEFKAAACQPLRLAELGLPVAPAAIAAAAIRY